MAERPILPLEAQAAIEQARETATSLRFAYPILHGLEFVGAITSPRTLRKPASLKLEFKKYSSMRFDLEAQQHIKHAQDEIQLRKWLSDLATCLTEEILEECKIHHSRHDFHCALAERKEAITEALKERIDHWVKTAENDPVAKMTRSSATIARLKATMTQAEKVLAELDAPSASRASKHAQLSDPIEPVSGRHVRAFTERPGTELPTDPPPSALAKSSEKRASSRMLVEFPRRSVWLSNRLRERGWRKNHLRRFGGPDRKTVQKILDGRSVTEEVLERVITALNKKKVGVQVDLLNIPSD